MWGLQSGGLTPMETLRAATLPLLGLAPLLLSGLLVASPTLASINGRSGVWGRLFAAYLSLTLVWVLLWAPLTWTYRVVGPGRPSWWAAFVGAVVSGAFVSGFLQGFIVFLAVPVDLGRPFGGLTGVGIATALLLWLWVMHAVVLIGYALTWSVDEALGRPSGAAGDGGPADVPRCGGPPTSEGCGKPPAHSPQAVSTTSADPAAGTR